MRRTFPLIATIAAEVAAVFGGAPPAVADTTAPEPVAVAQPETVHAEPTPEPTPGTPASDSAPAAPSDPVGLNRGDPVAATPPVKVPAPAFTVRTGRVGDPAAIALSLDGRSDATAGSSPKTTTERTGASDTTTSTTPQRQSAGRDRHSASDEVAQGPTASTPATASPAAPTVVSVGNASSHVIVAGDNLWDVAASHLASVTGRDVAALSIAEIVRYWVRVCDDNRAHLQSGDVSLIYAGELVELPAP